MDETKHLKTLEWTGERYLPEKKGGIALEHLHRYAMACQFAKGKNVLDIASGEGYGSTMLAKVANHVIGVDISEEAISFAKGKYSRDNLGFKVGSCAEIPLGDASLDLIVCFETIEHHNQHEAMLNEFKRVLHPNGVLIISSPDKHEYSDVPNFNNPFHVKELYRSEFESLVSKYFENMQIYGQRVIYGSGIFIEKGPASYVNFNEDGEVIDINDGLFRPVYNIVVASNTDLQEAVSGVFELPVWESDFAQSLTRERDQAVEQSNIAKAERDKEVNSLTAQLAEQDEKVNGLNAQLTEWDEAVNGLNAQMAERDATVNGLNAQMAERNEAVDGLTVQLAERDETVTGLNAQMAERDEKVTDLTAQLAEHDEKVNGLTTQLAEQDEAVNELNVKLTEQYKVVKELSAKLAEQDEKVNGLTVQLAEQDEKVNGLTTQLAERDTTVNGLNAQMAERDATAADLNAQMAERNATVIDLNAQLDEQDEKVNGLTVQLAEQDEKVNGLTTQLAEQGEAVNELNVKLTKQYKAVKELSTKLAERDATVTDLKAQMAERNATVIDLNAQLAEQDEKVNGLTTQLAERDEKVTDLTAQLSEQDNELNYILNSNSWRLTRPLRAIRRGLITIPNRLLSSYISNAARAIWYSLPLPVKGKLTFKNILFRIFPVFFKHTITYRAWETSNNAPTPQVYTPSQQETSQTIVQHVTSDKEYSKAVNSVPLLDADPLADPPVRLIAFYLPQFHPIPENDKWWGKGFTEWSNVKRSFSQFPGHYQPHVPGELGYYDLRNSKIQKRQVELAKLYGIGGFCFHFYWFAGKRLLELPIQQYVDDRDLDLPFCLCWANENWSRRWDGLDSDILISQDHSPEDDLAFIEHVSRYLRDPRYIRIHGKPLLIVYRPGLLPSAKKTAKRWRIWCRENDIGEIYLAYTQSFESVNPRKYGFDGAIEFPPNNTTPPVITSLVNPKDSDFSGVVYDWSIFVERSRKYQKPDYPLFRGVCPSWDNTARRMENAGIFLGSTPEKYSEWLKNASIETIRRFSDPSERLVFVNAWNEWAEGAYLEPDQRHGYAYLQATRDSLERINSRPGKKRIVLVAHDAHPHGAQYNMLHMAKILAEDFEFVLDMFVLGDGPLIESYARYATLHLLYGKDIKGEDVKALLANLYAEGVRSAIANTTVAGIFVNILKEQGFYVVSLIHELPGVIKEQKLQPHVKSIAEGADSIVFAAKTVMEGFECFSQVSLHKAVIRPQGLYKKNLLRNPNQVEEARRELRSRFGLPATAKIILCVGFADYRKGIDLFVEIGLKVLQRNTDAYFIWVGHFDSTIEPKIIKLVDDSRFSGHFVFPGHDFKTDLYYAGSDVYALTSREDPFPSVVLESLDANLPVVAFDRASGIIELLSRGGGRLIPSHDTTIFATELIELLRSPENARLLGKSGKKIVEKEFSMKHYMFDLVALAQEPLKRVSVIVPNYNYANFLVERIMSIVNQNYPIYEIIILDDASSDRSVPVINEIISKLNIDYQFIVNESNSGSPFLQWFKGIELAQGDYIWIAEADDLTEPGFLQEVMKPFDDSSIVMSYCQSKQMSTEGKILCNDYLGYLRDVSSEKWSNYYINEGTDEIRNTLAIKNTIPNVSSAVFERNALLNSLRENINEIKQYRVAGDWLTYIHVLDQGKIAYSPKPFNLHRRHQNSVTIGNFNLVQLEEIMALQKMVRHKFSPKRDVVKKAHNYAQQLYEQFELCSPNAPIISEHPRLSTYVER